VLFLILITCSKNRDLVQLTSLLPGQTIRPSGTWDKGKKSGTVPEIPGQLEPMYLDSKSSHLGSSPDREELRLTPKGVLAAQDLDGLPV